MIKDNLYKLKCTACSGKTSKLIDSEIDNNLNKLKNWQINDEKKMIFKKFKFKSFKKTLAFVNLVANISEIENHHPDISFGYSYCLILIHTHAINELSINDFILASKIDQISL